MDLRWPTYTAKYPQDVTARVQVVSGGGATG